MASILWQSFAPPRNLGEAVGNCKETGKVVNVSCLWLKSCSNLLMPEISCRQPELGFTVMLSRIISSASQA